METLYSLILWHKMGRKPKDYEIHNKPWAEVEEEFVKYLERVGPEKFQEDVQENSFMEIEKTDLYYDGHFYQNTDSYHVDTVEQDPEDSGRYTVKQIYHESMAESTILTMMMKHLNPDSSAFLAKIHREWYLKNNQENNEREP
jgi:hypothetical protein